jgi:hypothetical protein
MRRKRARGIIPGGADEPDLYRVPVLGPAQAMRRLSRSGGPWRPRKQQRKVNLKMASRATTKPATRRTQFTQRGAPSARAGPSGRYRPTPRFKKARHDGYQKGVLYALLDDETGFRRKIRPARTWFGRAFNKAYIRTGRVIRTMRRRRTDARRKGARPRYGRNANGRRR